MFSPWQQKFALWVHEKGNHEGVTSIIIMSNRELPENNKHRNKRVAPTPPSVASLFKSVNSESCNEKESTMRIDLDSDESADSSIGIPSTSTGIGRSIASFRKFCTHFV